LMAGMIDLVSTLCREQAREMGKRTLESSKAHAGRQTGPLGFTVFAALGTKDPTPQST
jgi:hypothetical protein